eukprot:1005871-Pyramimonas_sp.AAC.1
MQYGVIIALAVGLLQWLLASSRCACAIGSRFAWPAPRGHAWAIARHALHLRWPAALLLPSGVSARS